MNEAIRFTNVSRRYGKQEALSHVSFALPRTGLFAFVGPSGSGKSTALNLMAGLDKGYEGSVTVFGKEWKKANEKASRRRRIKTIGYLFQNFGLLELETVEGNVLSLIEAIFSCTRVEAKTKCHDLLSFFGMEKKARQRVNTLSGGEKQRVALARALAGDPKIVLADEPTGALDQSNAERVFSLLNAISLERLVIIVTHDEELARRYADAVITLRDGRIAKIERLGAKKKANAPKSFLLRKRKKKPRLPWRFLFFHALHGMLARKWRTLMGEAVVALGLIGFGISAFISGSISDELSAAFESITPENALVMAPRSGETSPIGAIYGAGFDECEYIVEEYGDMVSDYGTDLHLDYESWFIDHNEFTYQSGVESVRLKDFSTRSINDYRWFDETKAPVCYPRVPALMRVDEVVLGLPYENMFTTCLNLHILRNYQSLGDYIDAKGMVLRLLAANYEFGFEDEELFRVVAVVSSDVPCFYHADHRWNQKVFLDQMKFRSSINEVTKTPQYVFEIPYLALTVPPSEFLASARKDDRIAHLVYETARHDYVPTLCPVGAPCAEKRLYLYGADKTGVRFTDMDRCMEQCPQIIGRQALCEGSYYAAPSSLVMGFSLKFYLCRDRASAEQIVDAYSDLPLEDAFLPGEPIEGTKDGSFLSGNAGVQIGAAKKGGGTLPQSNEECLLSTELAEAWGHPKEVFVAAEIRGEEAGSTYVREMGIGSMKVVGEVSSRRNVFYVTDDWDVDFFLDQLGQSSFTLEPYGALFFLEEGTSADDTIATLSKTFPNYSFSCPSDEVTASLAEVLSYIGGVVMAFSFIALGMSSLLFFIVMTISIMENGKEERTLTMLGVAKNDVIRSYQAHAISFSIIATVTSVISVAFLEMATKIVIGKMFDTTPNATLPFWPLGVTLLSSGVFTFFIMLGISAYLRWKNREKVRIHR